MESTRRLSIELPEDIADAVEARVASGEYPNASAVLAESMRALDECEQEPDEEVERWLRDVVVPAYDRWKSGEDPGHTPDEIRAMIAELRTSYSRE